MHVLAWELGLPVEEQQLDEKCQPVQLPAELPYQLRSRCRGSPGCEHVIHDKHALSVLHGVSMNLQRIFAVLEVVTLLDRLGRKLPRLPDGYEARADALSNRGAQNES